MRSTLRPRAAQQKSPDTSGSTLDKLSVRHKENKKVKRLWLRGSYRFSLYGWGSFLFADSHPSLLPSPFYFAETGRYAGQVARITLFLFI
jgi:hypothetical protein